MPRRVQSQKMQENHDLIRAELMIQSRVGSGIAKEITQILEDPQVELCRI